MKCYKVLDHLVCPSVCLSGSHTFTNFLVSCTEKCDLLIIANLNHPLLYMNHKFISNKTRFVTFNLQFYFKDAVININN